MSKVALVTKNGTVIGIFVLPLPWKTFVASIELLVQAMKEIGVPDEMTIREITGREVNFHPNYQITRQASTSTPSLRTESHEAPK